MNHDQIVRQLRGLLNSGTLAQDDYEVVCAAIRALGERHEGGWEMTREDCWMTFTEALEQYLTARESNAPEGSHRWHEDQSFMRDAAEHMDALTRREPHE